MSDKPVKPFKLPNKRTWIKFKLRKLSLQWPARTEAYRRARVARGIYKCAMCQGENFRPKDIELDHVDPVIDIREGQTTLDEYIERLLPDVEGFQVLCKLCHSNKSQLENTMRQFYKTKKK